MAHHEPYDVNCVFRIRELENERVKLTPFIPDLHTNAFYSGTVRHPEMFTFVPMPPFESAEVVNEWIETRIRQDPGAVLFAMIDKTKPASLNLPPEANHEGALAGIIGIFNTSLENLSTELGLLFTLPPFQRTHVTSIACALLLEWCFEDLKMRRVQWRSDVNNHASVGLAEKLGFRKELWTRWGRVVARGPGQVEGLNVHTPRKGDPLEGTVNLHSLVLAICWDDWEQDGWRDRNEERLNRQ